MPPGKAAWQAKSLLYGYDKLAEEYDRLVTRDLWMRRVLWRHYTRVFRAGSRVLDVGCGTGLDALFLAQTGIVVAGIDASAGMIAELRKKADNSGAAIESRVGGGDDLSAWADASFDGILSSFAGLNAVNDLGAFAGEAARVLKPRGRMVAHLLGPHHIWHLLGLAVHGAWAEAGEYRRRREEVLVVAGQPMRHRLLPSGDTYRRYFAARFRLRRCYALGFLRPRDWDAWLPEAIADWTGHVEAVVGRLPLLRDWGGFFVLDLEKRGDGVEPAIEREGAIQ